MHYDGLAFVMQRHDPEIATFLFEHARDILLVIDAADGRLIDANATAEQAYGYPRDELLALTIHDVRAADPAPVSQQMEVASAQGILFESVHQRRDGTTFAVEVNSQGQTIRGRRVLLSVVRDISGRKRLEAEREALAETTRRALALRDEFIVVASHELRSPVTNVSLLLQQLKRVLDRGPAEPHAVAATAAALAEVVRLATLINTLLDAQVVGGEIVLARGPVNVNDLMAEVVSRLRIRAELAGSEVIVNVPPVCGRWDRLRLDQVFTNLVINALKYGAGRPIHIIGMVIDDHVEIEVRDLGIGISGADAARIFDKFERAVSPAYGGLGLGLYICRQLVEAHGGTISLHSDPGEGSTFCVTLPLG